MKFFTTMVLLIVAAALLPAQKVTVTSPKNGDIWEMGSTRSITWDAHGYTGNVSIEIFDTYTGTSSGGGKVTLSPYPAQNQQYSWKVGQLFTAGWHIMLGSEYEFHVVNLNDKSVGSSGKFTISGSWSVTSPKDGDSWPLGSTRLITWDNTHGPLGDIAIEIFQLDGNAWGEITPHPHPPAQNQQFAWEVGKMNSGPPLGVGHYQLHVIDQDGGGFKESGKFSIIAAMPDFDLLKKISIIEFSWPPQPDPCLCPEIDLRRLSEVLGQLSSRISIALLKNGQQVQQLGSFTPGSRLPVSLKVQLSRVNFDLLKRGGARFALAVLGPRGKILSRHDLQSRLEMTRR